MTALEVLPHLPYIGNMSIRTGHRKADGVSALPLAAIEPRDKLLRLRCSAGQLDAWQRAAAGEGRTLSELARQVLSEYCNVSLAQGGNMAFVKVTFGASRDGE